MLACLLLTRMLLPPACEPAASGPGAHAFVPPAPVCISTLPNGEKILIRWPWGPAPVVRPVPGFESEDFVLPKKAERKRKV